ncbi:hypothetical protein N9L76_06055 [bacterium]|nr:hypothetical protein [bacterium]|tara:strand:+ start:3079 stop:3477 length:399 start_codon:yes stop_codon:yes gene_type:complete
MCKAGVCEALLIPLYGRGVRGSDSNRRKNLGGKEKVPNRPKGLRVPSDDPRLSRVREDVGLMADLDLVGERLSGWGSNTASLFFIGGGPAWMPYSRGAHFPISMSPQQQHHVFLSRLLLLLGSFVILCLLIF